jgi:hypothetical protein
LLVEKTHSESGKRGSRGSRARFGDWKPRDFCTDDLRIRLKDVITRLPGWPCIQKTCVAISDGPSRNSRYEGVGRPLISSHKRSSSCAARRRTENGATRAVANSIATGSPSSFLQISATIGASASLSWKSPIFAVARSTKMLNGREAARLGGGEPGRCCWRARERRKAVHPFALGVQQFVVGCQVCTRQKCATRRGTSARPCRPPRPDARPRRSEGRARLPRRTGFLPSSRSRCAGSRRKGRNAIVRSSETTGRIGQSNFFLANST